MPFRCPENEGTHFRVPTFRLVPEMDTCFQKFLDRYRRQMISPLASIFPAGARGMTSLSLGELEAGACAFLPEFLPFLDSGIARQQARFAHARLQPRLEGDQRPGEAMTNCACLAVSRRRRAH